MLTSIRERATGWIAWAIVILITIPFALWGVNSYFTGGTNLSVAEIDGEDIDYQTYQRALYSERDRVRQRFGSNVDSELLSGNTLGRQVLNGLINDVLLFRDARDQGFRISDQQLVRAIREVEAFQNEDGSFSQERYERVLQFSGYAPSEFESVQRNGAVVQQIRNGFIRSVFDIKSAVDDMVLLVFQTRIGQYAVINPSDFIANTKITSEEIQAEYDKNKALYTEPERIKVQYIELSVSDFASEFQPSEASLRELYDAESAGFLEEERRSVSHILLEVTDEVGSEADLQALELASELVERLKSGEIFEGLAAEYSQDVGSVEAGGSIGWINRGVTELEFENAAFSMEQGVFSDPVRTTYGYHVIRVDEIRESAAADFEAVRDDLIERVKREQAESEMFEISEELRNIAYEQPESLEPAIESLGLTLKTSEWFTRTGGTGIGEIEKVREAAFSDIVVEQGFNSDVIDTDNNTQIVLRKLDHQAAEQLSLETVKAEITEGLLLSKSIDQAKSFATGLIDEMNNGRDWKSVIDEHGLGVSDLPSRIGNDSNPVVAEVTAHVYEADIPVAGSDVFGGGQLVDGRYTIFRISEVIYGDNSEASEEDREEIQTLLNLRFGFGLYENYVTHLRNSADININNDLL